MRVAFGKRVNGTFTLSDCGLVDEKITNKTRPKAKLPLHNYCHNLVISFSI